MYVSAVSDEQPHMLYLRSFVTWCINDKFLERLDIWKTGKVDRICLWFYWIERKKINIVAMLRKKRREKGSHFGWTDCMAGTGLSAVSSATGILQGVGYFLSMDNWWQFIRLEIISLWRPLYGWRRCLVNSNWQSKRLLFYWSLHMS